MTAPAAAPTTKTRAKTKYHILRERKGSQNPTWYEPVEAGIEANNAADALSVWADRNAEIGETGVYVALSASKFKPTSVSFTKKTVIKVGG